MTLHDDLSTFFKFEILNGLKFKEVLLKIVFEIGDNCLHIISVYNSVTAYFFVRLFQNQVDLVDKGHISRYKVIRLGLIDQSSLDLFRSRAETVVSGQIKPSQLGYRFIVFKNQVFRFIFLKLL